MPLTYHARWPRKAYCNGLASVRSSVSLSRRHNPRDSHSLGGGKRRGQLTLISDDKEDRYVLFVYLNGVKRISIIYIRTSLVTVNDFSEHRVTVLWHRSTSQTLSPVQWRRIRYETHTTITLVVWCLVHRSFSLTTKARSTLATMSKQHWLCRKDKISTQISNQIQIKFNKKYVLWNMVSAP